MTDHSHHQPPHHHHHHNTPLLVMTPPPTPPTAVRPTLSFSSSSMSPPHTPNRQRQVAWFQSSVVRRSSSAVDEAVDELTEKSQFLFNKRKRESSLTPRTDSVTTTTNRNDSSSVGSSSTQEADEAIMATFRREEIVAGDLLGEGTFSCVYEVKRFDLLKTDDDDEHDSSSSSSNQSLRQQLASSNPSRFALKHLKDTLLQNSHEFEQAATDLVMEAKYLAALNHPNILKLHGEPRNGTAAINNGVDGYFILCDRLSETLAGRIQRWKDGEAAETNNVPSKLSYALQIAQALSYLHEQRILFRDLKPSNVGFHQQDQERIQLFDFGLCRELPPQEQARSYVYEITDDNKSEYSVDMDDSWKNDEEQVLEQVYLMSGAGTQIYMAPEVLVQNRYNLKADVYSWAMTVTELLLLEKPLPHYELDEHIQYVCIEGDRPALEGHPEITDPVRDLLAWAWEGNVSKRCSIAQVCDELQGLVADQGRPETPDRPNCWSSRIFRAASRFPKYLLSVMEGALERISSFLFRRNNGGRDVTFDLPQEEGEPRDEVTRRTQEEGSSQLPGDDSAPPEGGCGLSPRPPPRFSRSALLKRKPSSASTTGMTDDELDDEELGGVGVPLFPSLPKPPMEALVERHNSTNSAA